jgi:hypothetical protein
MDELIGRLVAGSGVNETDGARAVGNILLFPVEAGASDKVDAGMHDLPGGDATVQIARHIHVSGGMFGAVARIAGDGTRILVGLSMGHAQARACRTNGCVRDMVGDDTLDPIIAAIRGLGQSVLRSAE